MFVHSRGVLFFDEPLEEGRELHETRPKEFVLYVLFLGV